MFLVTDQDLMSLENAREFLRMADERGKGADRIKVLLNKVPVRQKPDLDSLEKYLGVRPASVFNDDSEALYEIWSEGRMLSSGGSVLGRQLAALTRSMLSLEAPEPEMKHGSTLAASMAAAIGLGRFFSFARGNQA